jgi:perosamine synthetase
MQPLAISGGKPRVGANQHVRWPVLSSEDKTAVLGVLERGVLSGPFAPEVRALEQEFAAYVGAKHCLTTNSGTAALHIALAAAGVGPGDEVVVPAFTFVATALSVLHQNAIPVFVDIEPQTWGMDPKLLEAAITPRTKAIMPVHIHGTPCDFDAIRTVAAHHGIPVIEDACQAAGSEYRGKKVGSLGHMAAFSLQSSKNLACGEGGLFVTSDPELLERTSARAMAASIGSIALWMPIVPMIR